MKGVLARQGRLEWTEVAEPVPGPGQVLVETLTCGICGTDLHALHHSRDFLAGLARSGTPLATDPDAGFVMGHEFCAEILDHGPDTPQRLEPGTRVVGLPFLTSPRGTEYAGYSDEYPGGFAERMVLTERLLHAVPNGLPSTLAALTEPFSVGAHAVGRSRAEPGDVCLVVGAGPIGLAVIAALRARGLGPIVAMDYSPGRRGFAEAMGADEVVDAAVESQRDVWSRVGRGRQAVAFECVGRPGVADGVVDAAPRRARVVVVGNSLEQCTIDQVVAFNKELEIVFSLNYSVDEFGRTLDDLAEGRIDADPVITGVVAPQDTPEAFEALRDPERHAKIVVSFR